MLYVGEAPLKMTGRVQHPRLDYSYEVTDIREFDATQLAASESISDNLIAVLCRNGTDPAIVQQVLWKIARLPKQQSMDCLEQLLRLSMLRKADSIVIKEYRTMSLEINIEDSPFLRGILLKGEKRGEKRGIRLGASWLLQSQLEGRFGKLPKWALQQLQKANTKTLELWADKVIGAKRLEDVIPKPPRAPIRKKS